MFGKTYLVNMEHPPECLLALLRRMVSPLNVDDDFVRKIAFSRLGRK